MDELFNKILGVDVNLQETIQLYALLLARITPTLFQTPFLGGNLVQGTAKIGISMVLVFFFYPLVYSTVDPPLPPEFGLYILLLLKEFFIGFVLGFLASLPFYYVTAAGNNMDMARGASMGMMQNPGVSEQVTFLSNFMYWFMIFLFLASGGHRVYIRGLAQTFIIVPPTGWLEFGVGFTPFVERVVRLTADTFVVMLQLGAPVLIVMFVTDVVFGLFNRIASQMQVGEMSMILKLLLGLWIFFLSIPVLVRVMYQLLDGMLDNIVGILSLV